MEQETSAQIEQAQLYDVIVFWKTVRVSLEKALWIQLLQSIEIFVVCLAAILLVIHFNVYHPPLLLVAVIDIICESITIFMTVQQLGCCRKQQNSSQIKFICRKLPVDLEMPDPFDPAQLYDAVLFGKTFQVTFDKALYIRFAKIAKGLLTSSAALFALIYFPGRNIAILICAIITWICAVICLLLAVKQLIRYRKYLKTHNK